MKKGYVAIMLIGFGFIWYKIDKNSREAWYRKYLETYEFEYYERSRNIFERTKRKLEHRYEKFEESE